MKRNQSVLLLPLIWLAAPPATLAHGGGLNAQGCHNESANGGYHCHQPKGAEPVKTQREPFRNCAEARAAGAAPVMRGDAGYGAHLDRDGDGVGCE